MEDKILSSFDKLQSRVQQITDWDQSVLLVIEGIRVMYAEAGDHPDKRTAVDRLVHTRGQELVAAIRTGAEAPKPKEVFGTATDGDNQEETGKVPAKTTKK